MEEEPGTIEERGGFEGDIGMALERQPEILPSTEFVKVEKNLASLGFFTPSSKRLRNAQEKSFTITTVADGERMELKGTIIPSAKYGLPITADQDKWIALCKILTDIMRKEGRVTNPIAFTSACYESIATAEKIIAKWKSGSTYCFRRQFSLKGSCISRMKNGASKTGSAYSSAR